MLESFRNPCLMNWTTSLSWKLFDQKELMLFGNRMPAQCHQTKMSSEIVNWNCSRWNFVGFSFRISEMLPIFGTSFDFALIWQQISHLDWIYISTSAGNNISTCRRFSAFSDKNSCDLHICFSKFYFLGGRFRFPYQWKWFVLLSAICIPCK